MNNNVAIINPFIVVWDNGVVDIKDGRGISNLYDLSDCGHMDGVLAVYALNENNEPVKIRLGELIRGHDESTDTLIYAQSQIFAGKKLVGHVHWSDH